MKTTCRSLRRAAVVTVAAAVLDAGVGDGGLIGAVYIALICDYRCWHCVLLVGLLEAPLVLVMVSMFLATQAL